ncbi:type I-E CRISPR-associated protein Cse2/CasB [uncultured Rothia sp.]|uniref:type I-E CRISPR-associated protein Cse2/CasB n=1 Tax=uncultured Rothia sp. TaxID=316088 RepID=UPI00321791F0
MTNPEVESEATEKAPTFYGTIASAIYRLQSGVTGGADNSATRAQLARLRQAAGRTPEKDPLAWSIVLEQILPDFRWAGSKDTPNAAESAAYSALTLYALHQRSRSQPMHKKHKFIGQAVAELAKKTESKSIKGRFDALMTSTTPKSMNYHLRSLVNLLNSHEIPLDYAALASDLCALQRPEDRPGVILQWGRDFASGLWTKPDNK